MVFYKSLASFEGKENLILEKRSALLQDLVMMPSGIFLSSHNLQISSIPCDFWITFYDSLILSEANSCSDCYSVVSFLTSIVIIFTCNDCTLWSSSTILMKLDMVSS